MCVCVCGVCERERETKLHPPWKEEDTVVIHIQCTVHVLSLFIRLRCFDLYIYMYMYV